MISLACAACALAIGATPRAAHHPSFLGSRFGRDAALVTPAPYPPARTDDAFRAERSRVWVSAGPVGSRTPTPQRVLGAPGPASYGAPAGAAPEVLVRIGHTPISIDPFTRIEGGGSLARLERARNLWLAEQGYVLHVRTHTNGAPRQPSQAQAGVTSAEAAPVNAAPLPRPRATIRITPDEPRPRRDRMRVLAPRVVEPAAPVASANEA